jgi:RNA polymerase-binding transcription factor DksA
VAFEEAQMDRTTAMHDQALTRLAEEESRWRSEHEHRDRDQAGLEVEAAVGSTVQAGDRSDIATATRAWEEDAEFLRTAENALAEIAAARQRLEAGTYGRCARCGEEIGAERLDALPATRFCVRHA